VAKVDWLAEEGLENETLNSPAENACRLNRMPHSQPLLELEAKS